MVEGTLYYLVFFVSGMAGLVYEIVWSREMLLLFGNTTYSVTAVVCAFMAGLGIGSFVFGKLADRVKNLVRLYAWLEIGVAVGAVFFQVVRPLLQANYLEWLRGMDQGVELLVIKFVMAGVLMLPATICMGGTLPVLVKYLSRKNKNTAVNVSRLYFVNTLGAFFGVLVSGFVLIETLGLSATSETAIIINLALGAIMLGVGAKLKLKDEKIKTEMKKISKMEIDESFKKIVVVFGLSGFVSMAYQILWVRLLTPSMGTLVYAFAIILAMYLLGIALGSWAFEKLAGEIKNTQGIFAVLEMLIGVCAILSVVVLTRVTKFSQLDGMALAVFPGAFAMGMTFPVAAKAIKKLGNEGTEVGKLYVSNTLGSVVGTLSASLILIPTLGTARSILMLALVNFVLAAVLMWQEKRYQFAYGRLAVVGLLIVAAGWIMQIDSYQLQPAKIRKGLDELQAKTKYTIVEKEDEVASVVVARSEDGKDRYLLIDGVPTTTIQAETALIAQLPIALSQDPKDMLIIALGMGNTYRTALLQEKLKVDVVELVPSVPQMMKYFHDDYEEFAHDPRGRIIVNDGRNYLRTNTKQYDIIVVDPPPPVNSSGTTILYSKEFYDDAKKLLRPGGIFLSWFYNGTRADDYKMLMRSFYESFPQILAVQSPCKCGYFLLGAEGTLKWDENKLRKALGEKMMVNINVGLPEDKKLKVDDILKLYVGDASVVDKYTRGFEAVTDEFPRTEYSFLRWKRNIFPEADASPL